MKNKVLVFSILILLFLSSFIAYAQQTPKLQFYDVSSGLPSNHLYKIVQDKKGFLWIATENGISRFDGHSFKNYSVKEGLIDNDIINIFLDAMGNIWCIPFAGSPFYYDITQELLINKRKVPDLGKIESKKFISAHSNTDSSVSFNDGSSIFLFKNGKIIFEKKLAVASKSLVSYHTVQNGKSYVICANGNLFQLKDDKLLFMDSLPFRHVIRSGSSEENNEITLNIEDNRIVKFSINADSKLEGLIVSSLKISHASTTFQYNTISVAGREQTIYLLDKKSLAVQQAIITNADNMHVFEDKDKTIWVATFDKGLIKITNPIFRDHHIPFTNNKQIQTVYEAKDGLVVGNSMGEIFVHHQNKWKFVSQASPGNENHYLKRIVSSGKNIFVGGAYSFSYFSKQKFTTSRKNMNPKIVNGIKDLYVYQDSILFVGTVGALVKINTNNWQEKILDSVRSSCITIDNEGRIYRGSKSGVSIFENDKLLPITSYDPSFAVNFIRFTTSPDGVVWGGTSNDTLYAFKDLKVIKKITFSDRNLGSLCKGLKSVRPGELWYATDNGLIKINYKIHDNDLGYSTISFGANEGLGNCTINDIFIFKDSISMATSNGLKRMCINTLPTIHDIPTFLSEIQVNSITKKFSDKMILSNSSEYLQLIYTAIDYTGAMINLQYKINNAEWQSLNGNTLTLTNMNSGNYVISTRAINKNGQASSIVNKFKLKVEAPFWKKPWFLLLLFFTALGGIILLQQRRNKIRLANQKRQSAAIALQREKIIADLHDDIGASLSSVQINSAVAAKLFDSNPKESKNLLTKLEKQSQNLSERIGDFIWSMKPGKDEFLNISERIKNYAAEILNAKNIQFKIDVTERADELLIDFDIRKNILLIAKEAINNAAKYSEGSKVWVTLNEDGENMILTINDDGKGIENENAIGNGLRNMNKRAQELGGILNVKNLNPSGTSINATIPLPNIKEKKRY